MSYIYADVHTYICPYHGVFRTCSSVARVNPLSHSLSPPPPHSLSIGLTHYAHLRLGGPGQEGADVLGHLRRRGGGAVVVVDRAVVERRRHADPL